MPFESSRSLSYAGVRLRLGITGVGVWVILASLILAADRGSRPALWQAVVGYVALSVPLDLLGGQILPRLWRQPVVDFGRWASCYIRALALHVGLMTAGISLTWIANWACGPTAAAIAYTLAALLFLRFQLLALTWTGIETTSRDGVVRVHCHDRRFTGGLVGWPWPGCEKPVVPAHWSSPDAPIGLDYHLARRRRTSRLGSRAVGALLAIGYNAVGLRFVLAFAGESAVSVACAFTLWSFMGLLLLPSLSRPGVFAADSAMRRSLGQPGSLRWLGWLESFQEEDAVRLAWTERIFHPLPQWSDRRRKLETTSAEKFRPWNIARYALVTSMLAGSLLSRAVHCNCGRPELWFWPPND